MCKSQAKAFSGFSNDVNHKSYIYIYKLSV